MAGIRLKVSCVSVCVCECMCVSVCVCVINKDLGCVRSDLELNDTNISSVKLRRYFLHSNV